MSDINDTAKYLDESGLHTLEARVAEVFAKKTDTTKSIKATYEQSPTNSAHSVGEYLYVKTSETTHVTYEVITAIAANTELVVGSNVKVFNDAGIPLYVDKVPGSAGPGGGGSGISPEYTYDTSPTTKAHSEGDKIWYDNNPYTATSNIAIGTALVVGTNISLDADIPEGVLMSIIGAEGGDSTALKTRYVGATTTVAIPEGRIIFYINKFKRVIKEGGLPANYTIVPNTDLEDAGLSTNVMTAVSGIPKNGAVNASDVTFDNTDTGMTATDVQGAVTELNSKMTLKATGNTNTDFATATANITKEQFVNSKVIVNYNGSTWYLSPTEFNDKHYSKMISIGGGTSIIYIWIINNGFKYRSGTTDTDLNNVGNWELYY